jgi:hypothetical protein
MLSVRRIRSSPGGYHLDEHIIGAHYWSVANLGIYKVSGSQCTLGSQACCLSACAACRDQVYRSGGKY